MSVPSTEGEMCRNSEHQRGERSFDFRHAHLTKIYPKIHEHHPNRPDADVTVQCRVKVNTPGTRLEHIERSSRHAAVWRVLRQFFLRGCTWFQVSIFYTFFVDGVVEEFDFKRRYTSVCLFARRRVCRPMLCLYASSDMPMTDTERI